MKKSSSRVPMLVVLLAIAAGSLYLVKRREAKQRDVDASETSTSFDLTKEATGGKKASSTKQGSVSAKVREDALKAIAASQKADEEQGVQDEKARQKLAKVLPQGQAQDMLHQLQKTFVDGKPTAATQKLAREMASRQNFKDAKRIASDYSNDQAVRRKKLVDVFSPALRAEADKGYKANIKGVWEKKAK